MIPSQLVVINSELYIFALFAVSQMAILFTASFRNHKKYQKSTISQRL